MKNRIEIHSNDPKLDELNFKAYVSTIERRFERFLPTGEEPFTKEIQTPWGETLTVKSGDYLVSELNESEDQWPVDAEIFEALYRVTRPGYCCKKWVTYLVPLLELTSGDPEQMVTIYALEGPQTVPAGDFYLARGTRGEIWAYPAIKVNLIMKLDDSQT